MWAGVKKKHVLHCNSTHRQPQCIECCTLMEIMRAKCRGLRLTRRTGLIQRNTRKPYCIYHTYMHSNGQLRAAVLAEMFYRSIMHIYIYSLSIFASYWDFCMLFLITCTTKLECFRLLSNDNHFNPL